MFVPKLFTTLKNYTRGQFFKDLSAGVIVGIVALPLAIAFAIASGVSPEKGLYTAIIAGFVISALGGSRVQIGGPTGAFIVIVYGIVQTYGVEGLTIATFMAGVMIMLMGFAKLGSFIKFVPHSLIVGFTSGIALIIFSSQMKDLFGLKMGTVPSGFIDKWAAYFSAAGSFNLYALLIASATILISVYFSKITRLVPGSLVAIIAATCAVHFLHLPVETIGSRFGSIPSTLPVPSFQIPSLETIKELIQPAFTIALLGSIESLLSAVVADGMIGGNHRSNMELVAQGGANILSSVFGGIPATGAIARTATNIKSGARTPVAGIVHAITLLIIMLFVGKWATLIPLSCLAGILVLVSYNMSEWQSFASLLKGPKNDVAILLVTFFLTVLIDLTVAIEIGMVMAAFLFMHRMTRISKVNVITADVRKDEEEEDDEKAIGKYSFPDTIEVFEITGPFFFGAAYKFKDSIRVIEKKPRILIIRMRFVPVIDATGIHTLEQVMKEMSAQGTIMLLSGVQLDVEQALESSGFSKKIGRENILNSIEEALTRANEILSK